MLVETRVNIGGAGSMIAVTVMLTTSGFFRTGTILISDAAAVSYTSRISSSFGEFCADA